jgi:hypothetical protein
MELPYSLINWFVKTFAYTAFGMMRSILENVNNSQFAERISTKPVYRDVQAIVDAFFVE